MRALAALLLAVVGLAAASGAVVAARSADDPIVGLWGRSDGRQVRVAGGGGSFSGTIARSLSTCTPVGKQVWRIAGSGGSYSGTMWWYDTSDCSSLGWGRATWKLDGDSLTHCTWNVAGEATGCVGYARVGGTAADTTAPEVRAFTVSQSVQPGGTAKLHYRVRDDSGKATVHVVLWQGGTRVSDTVVSGSAERIFTDHVADVKLGGGLVGPLFYCVWAQDATGNRSGEKSACGWIPLVVPIERVSNGCGGAGWEQWVKAQNLLLNTSRYSDAKTGKTYRVGFKAACDLHDAGYGGFAVRDAINGGTVDFRTWSRPQVDRKFLRDMQTLCRRQIPAEARDALAKCLGENRSVSISAQDRYDAVAKVGYRFFDADLTKPDTQRSGARRNF
ncbi:MAG TPA: hypothetical protein VFJ91_08230 [Gaiellaceae bacterium]|nr:hypothetical protein [Gaiellaceae bacterium]